jgi:hypothetical protein
VGFAEGLDWVTWALEPLGRFSVKSLHHKICQDNNFPLTKTMQIIKKHIAIGKGQFSSYVF